MDIITYLPPLQAILNSIATIFMTLGYYFIRNKNEAVHRFCMIGTLFVSCLFMISYTYYHLMVGNIPFAGQGVIRPVYFTLLATHILLAALTLPLVITTVTYILIGKREKHRKLAKWTLPIWLYVSITGVIIYLMAFHIYQPVK
ncbi:MAG: DUF420 domain-containing protein [Gammaproteobacteria bacterium]|nr:DUF420 domain-containing protein [Gammaproteobacteria bacterium]